MIKKVVLALSLAIVPLASFATQFYEGTHYTQVTDNAPSKEPKLTEFFSFYCHNCYTFESEYMPAMKPHLNKKLSVEAKHVEFQRSQIMTEVMQALAVIQEVAKNNPKQKSQMTLALFQAIQGSDTDVDHGAAGHEHKSKINSRDDIKRLFMPFGITAQQYDKLADSKQTDATLKEWRQDQRNFKIQSVPAFIVNDKYMVNLGSIRNLGEMIELINFLSTKHS